MDCLKRERVYEIDHLLRELRRKQKKIQPLVWTKYDEDIIFLEENV